MKKFLLLVFSIIVVSMTYAQDEQAKSLNNDFMIKKIETKLKWQDIELEKRALNQIKEIKNWLKDSNTLLHHKDWKIRGGKRRYHLVLFHGQHETEKTLTASLLGKYYNKDVFRVDLSTVVSKYIGETEKNLAEVFKMAKFKESILFFDEADALFGKRTHIRDSHDKYANQGVSYLLHRIETHSGLVIISTTSKDKIDKEFIRKFHTIIKF